jgi:NAD(P)-dependent dehydrogenase (short-subunit alcohol dehydrogenase family)
MRRLEQREFGGLCDAAARVEREFGRIDILFANAGVKAFKPILDMDDADWHDQIDVNLTGTANAIRTFGPAMVRRGGGRTHDPDLVHAGAARHKKRRGLFGFKMGRDRADEIDRHGSRRTRHHRERLDPRSDR